MTGESLQYPEEKETMEAGTSKNNPLLPENTVFTNELVLTQDGSHTLYSARFNQWYHSIHGALEESKRIFLELGLEYALSIWPDKKKIRILEMGFGTGFNALLTFLATQNLPITVHYTSLEAYPIPQEEYQKLNYDEVMHTSILQRLHEAEWNTDVTLTETFILHKIHTPVEAYLDRFFQAEPFDVVYYDAFAPGSQPELWTSDIFQGIAKRLHVNSILTTYSAKGEVRRALQAAGFRVEKHPGPGRKREVVRAICTNL
ncbi:MAG: tRNA (5-methylaminomethyl-2-thiouridine)(34)-methyltransferase MnmD [Siphonobacter sp.]